MKGYLFLSFFVLASCSHVPHAPVKTNPPIEIITNVEVIPDSNLSKASIIAVAGTSSCSKIKWGNRGVAPKGYVEGMALVFARSICKPSPAVSSPVKGSSSVDALAYYDITPSNKNAYGFLIGLGMRESAGKYCEGRDMSATNTSATSAEAGMFQTSYNSSSASVELPVMLKNYDRECYLDVFKQGAKCKDSDALTYGSGIGLDFQKKARQCPAFAAEYAAVTIRTLRKHYGPINRKEVEFKQECVNMLSEVEAIVKANPSICSAL